MANKPDVPAVEGIQNIPCKGRQSKETITIQTIYSSVSSPDKTKARRGVLLCVHAETPRAATCRNLKTGVVYTNIRRGIIGCVITCPPSAVD